MTAPLILAIHEDTNANAALLRGNRILAAVAEERLTRTKFQSGHPRLAVQEVLRLAGVAMDEVDAVVAGNRFHFLPRVMGKAIEGEHDMFGPQHKAWLTLQGRFHKPGPLAHGLEAVSRKMLARRFGRDVPLIDHHTAHAYSAYLSSEFPECTAITVDNMGDGFSTGVFRCRGGRCEQLWGSSAVDSPGEFYGEISQYLGFRILDAGKVTGLAARGDASRAYPVMEKLFRLRRDDTDFALAWHWPKNKERGLFRDLAPYSREDISAAAQKRLEDLLVAYVLRALRETGDRHIVLAGGVFANVRVNQLLWRRPEIDGIWIHPAMTDQGIAVGAGLAWLAQTHGAEPHALPHAYLGTEISEESIGDLLERGGVPHERCEDIDARVAQLLIEKKVVARVTGRMEYGPRALGHRSILFHTADPSVNDWLNHRLDRSEFMPFAPATMVEHAAECYRDYGPGLAHAARYMTVCMDTTPAMRKASPAVVHIDGTARPQVVHPEHDPGYHRIIALYREATGVPTILNTSYNIHGEPIACTAADALDIFQRKEVDCLALGPFLLQRGE